MCGRVVKVALLICGTLAILTTLPGATRCNSYPSSSSSSSSSYYEQYYAARRYPPPPPPQRTALLAHNFTLMVARDEILMPYEQLALVGDAKQLGAWSPARALLMNRTAQHGTWTAHVLLPANNSVCYRYFVAAQDKSSGALQIRRWESSLRARCFNTSSGSSAEAHNRTTMDIFGRINATAPREVRPGWLHGSTSIVQFKLFRDPFAIFGHNLSDASAAASRAESQIYVKLQPLEPERLTPIMPSATAHAECVRMQHGDSYLRAQPEYGVPYRPNDVVIFHTTLAAAQRVAYLLKVYHAPGNGELVRLLGYQYIYPSAVQGSVGRISVQLISPVWLHAIGSVELQYLVIAPLPPAAAPIVDFRTSFADYWRPNWSALDVGHRGLGRSLKLAGKNAPAIAENTLATMQAAAQLGADLVEFDVMLTSDLVPIVYHDYVVHVCMDSKTPKSVQDLTPVLIKDITYEQLKNLKTYQAVGNKIVEYPAHNNVEQPEYRLFPRFEDFLTQLNLSLGFDIEIKWPQQRRDGSHESAQTIDKNLYVDRILEVMLRHGCGRFSFFSSFDADICTLLRHKQNMYPVYMLLPELATYADPRSDGIYDAINNAQAFNLAGVVPHARFLQQNTNWIDVAERQQQRLFVWGDPLKDAESIAWFKATGVTGVIYDRVDLWLPLDKESAFRSEPDLPEFFQLQCPAKSAVNATAERILSNVQFL